MFQGGGALQVGPAQITDDSEMALCILHGLTDIECSVEHNLANKVLNLDGITHYFGRWSRNAFDIGITTSQALRSVTDITNKKHTDTTSVFNTVYRKNFDS